MKYFYAPIENTPEGYIKPAGEIPPRVRALELDVNAQRFVLLAHQESIPIPAEWSEQSEAQVKADYPDLPWGS